jgi:hypothetical protein
LGVKNNTLPSRQNDTENREVKMHRNSQREEELNKLRQRYGMRSGSVFWKPTAWLIVAGNFVWSLTYTDLASTWTERRAIWNRGASGVVECTEDVEKTLPFVILGFDFDNGSEWLNWNLIRYLQVRARPVRLTRSRPYHKDDNAHVEQKNWMWPGQLLGYQRLEQEALVEPCASLLQKRDALLGGNRSASVNTSTS